MWYLVTVPLPSEFVQPSGRLKLDFLITLATLSNDESPSLLIRQGNCALEFRLWNKSITEAVGVARAVTLKALKVIGQGDLELGKPHLVPAQLYLD
jgi:hypothetical protein